MPVNLSTVQKWIKDVDSLGECMVTVWRVGGKVTRIFCALCSKHQDRLRAVRNFSSAFVDGITETALKKDNVCKHQRSDMHGKAVNMEREPTINEIYSSTPLWRAFASASLEEINRVSKPFDIGLFSIASWWGKNAHTLFNYNRFKPGFLLMPRCMRFKVTSM